MLAWRKYVRRALLRASHLVDPLGRALMYAAMGTMRARRSARGHRAALERVLRRRRRYDVRVMPTMAPRSAFGPIGVLYVSGAAGWPRTACLVGPNAAAAMTTTSSWTAICKGRSAHATRLDCSS